MPRLLYVSFDEVPAPKGACRHIEAVVRALGARYGDVTLVTPGASDRGSQPTFPGVLQQVLGCPDDNLLGRVAIFRAKLRRLLQSSPPFDLAQFRSPWEGIPLAEFSAETQLLLIYEVNGLPSVELKYHHRGFSEAPDLAAKVEQQERLCLTAAHAVVTVSDVNREAVLSRGAAVGKVQVIRNGVDLARFPYRPPAAPAGGPLRVAYVGTFAAWQGVEVLLEAVALLNKQLPAALTLLGAAAPRRREQLTALAAAYGLAGPLEMPPAGDVSAVARLLHASHIAAAPLLPVDRNLVQGCCPLKLLEAFAAGCPVVASELPVVCELATPGVHFEPARAGDSRSLKNALLRLAGDWPRAVAMSAAARQRVADELTWEKSHAQLLALYERLLGRPV